MKIYVNRVPQSGPWGGGDKFVSAFYKNIPEDELVPATSQNVAIDAVVLIGLENDGQGISAEQAIMYKMYASERNVKLVLRVNENDARKGTTGVDKKWIEYSAHVDSTVFVSEWLRDYFVNEREWKNDNCTVIKNGVDHEIFKPGTKLDNGKLNIVAHHWSDNYMKGFDIYDELDKFVGKNPDKYSFTYIGRDRGTFKNTNVIKPLFGKKMGEELGKYDVYVSASRFDPGPNHILEAVACGLPTFVHEDGGGAVEFAGPDASYDSWESLCGRLVNRDFPKNPPQITDWETCIKQYADFVRAP
jgi:glycosyltransferase involved in cell wall biosynthesis